MEIKEKIHAIEQNTDKIVRAQAFKKKSRSLIKQLCINVSFWISVRHLPKRH